MTENGTTFVLVHGSWHGAWCWERVIPELERLGHEAVAVELPSDDVAATTEDLAKSISDHIAEPGRTVLVAHSMSGLIAPLVAGRMPVRELVFLASLLPLPGHSWRDQLLAEKPLRSQYRDFSARQLHDEQGRYYWRPQDAADYLYNDCSPADAAEAVAKLRPQAPNATGEVTPLTEFPRVPSRYIVCRADRAIDNEWAAHAASTRFGSTIAWFGASHSPFWSRPADLAAVLAGPHI